MTRKLIGVVLSGWMVAACAASTASTGVTTAPTSATEPAASTGSTASPSSAAPSSSASTTPVGLAVLGHSGATGYDSDPDQPGVDVEANSWATGTNPEVDSIYQRLLATDPSIDGHATNLAVDGSDVDGLVRQATDLVARTPPPALVLIQTIDNDLQCDGTDPANEPTYRTKLGEALDTISQGLPDTRIFIVSVWADVQTYDRAVFKVQPSHLTGDGPCDTVSPDTQQLDPTKEAAFQALTDDYWDIVTEVCAAHPTCETDGGAMQTMDLQPDDLAEDLNHLSVSGHAKMAALAWDALERAGS